MARNNQTFKEKSTSIFLNLFCKIEEALPNLFYVATVTLITKPHKDSTKIEHYTQISPMNINAKILCKILANSIQKHIKNVIHMIK